MANFIGGSAPAMASQICEGFLLLSTATLKGFLPGDLSNLRLEVDKLLRDVRAQVPVQDDAQAQAARNRKIARLSSAMQVIQAKMSAKH
jgi:hypothetical protein